MERYPHFFWILWKKLYIKEAYISKNPVFKPFIMVDIS